MKSKALVEAESAKQYISRMVMREFRFTSNPRHTATVCFSVFARTPEDAVVKANEFWQSISPGEGFDIQTDDDKNDVRLYLDWDHKWTEADINEEVRQVDRVDPRDLN
jgi:hypothetical protein